MEGLENTSQETDTRGKPRGERRRMHTRGALRQDQEAEESTPERRKWQHHEYRERGAQDEPTGKGTEKPRVKERTHRRDPEGRNGVTAKRPKRGRAYSCREGSQSTNQTTGNCER